ncbi:hypothetical protein VTN77DRAFT_4784 [Rasamsonia byssochlamydoides]|uniref:uncharacterized protein n=1 Tax=Rasamsonia byssochlamydoides TaxID=89139 RepID=UPI0037433876
MATAPKDKLEDEVPDVMVASFFSSQSELSTVPSLFDERAAEDRVAHYHPRNNEDRTQLVLSSFLRFLPTEGKQMLAEFIANTVDDKTLYSLYSHLLTSILVPMKARALPPAITPSPYHDAVEQIAALMDKSPSRSS